MERKIYTVGHSTYSIEKFLDILLKNNVSCIVDVRSVPYSQFAPQFNKNDIKYYLNQNGIAYIHMGNEFGARREDKLLYRTDGKLDFDKTKKSDDFKQGVKRLEEGIEKGYCIALMCSEKMPQECHRSILIGKELIDQGFEVEHILEDATKINQNDITDILIEKYFPERNQLSLFDSENYSDDDYIREAYRKREEEIAYNYLEELAE